VLDVTRLLDELKASPYEELEIRAPHSGVVEFADLQPGASVLGPSGAWKEKPGTLLAFIERERNRKPISSPLKGELVAFSSDCTGRFVEAGETLVRLRHFLSKEEVIGAILKKALYLFPAPERARYYFIPELDKKIKAGGARSVSTREGMDMLIMSRMKRETPVPYHGPDGIIYAVYFGAEVVDAGYPLLGVCGTDQFSLINDVIVRVQTEWEEPE